MISLQTGPEYTVSHYEQQLDHVHVQYVVPDADLRGVCTGFDNSNCQYRDMTCPEFVLAKTWDWYASAINRIAASCLIASKDECLDFLTLDESASRYQVMLAYDGLTNGIVFFDTIARF